jgi:hypothetical protein
VVKVIEEIKNIKKLKEKNAVFWDVTSCGSCKNLSSEMSVLTRAT